MTQPSAFAFIPTRLPALRSSYARLAPAKQTAPHHTPLLAHVSYRPHSSVPFRPVRPHAASPPQSSAAPAAAPDTPSQTNSNAKPAWLTPFESFSTVFTNLFPLWTVLSAALALLRPATFAWLSTPLFTAFLGLLMLSMGITLTPADFARVLPRSNSVIVQFLLCYGLIPYLALFISRTLSLPPDLTAGMVLVGSVNGGQASNLCTFIAKGNVALSVIMTTVTTIGAIFMTPLLSRFIIGTTVPVDAAGMAVSTVQVVLLPIALGMLLNKYTPKVVRAVLPFAPSVGVIATCLLVGASVAQCAPAVISAGLTLQIAAAALHLLGGIAGYWVPRALKFNETVCRTMAIETAMKSSAFGFLLASLHFKAYAARVPSAVSVVWMALMGSILAVAWRFMPIDQKIHFDRSLAKKRTRTSSSQSNPPTTQP